MTTIDHQTPPSGETIITRLARRCAKSMEGLRGRKRDTATVCFWLGASQAAYEFGKPEEGEWINRVTSLLIATRGFSEVERMIKAAEVQAAFDAAGHAAEHAGHN